MTEQLSNSGAGYQLTDDSDTVELYDSNGILQSITDRAGNVQTLAYDPSSGKLLTVSDNFGHSLSFGYDANGRLQTVTDPNQQTTLYGFDDAGHLATITRPDNTVRTYVYTDPNWSSGLSSVIDENNQTVFTLAYDAYGRVSTSQLGGVSSSMTFAYNADGSTTQTDSLGAVRTFVSKQIGGHMLSSAVTGAPCLSCGYRLATTYDAAGFLSSETDYNNVATQYVYDDTRGLETSRTEAAGTDQARTISTTYIPNYRLPAEIDEPGRSTSFGYDATGNLLTKTVTDTGTQRARTWTWSNYDSYGRPQTIDGPRTDVADVSQLSYYPVVSGDPNSGQLHTITDALGHVTTITSYDANGRPLSMTDANGLGTTLAYNVRGWLTDKTVGGENTHYDYDGVGQLKKVTLPSGAYMAYTYDAAHRLTDIADAFGNTVHYTLDAMGNRTAEQVKDPSGTLTQTRSRVYNSLNRLTQEIGASSSESTSYGYDDNGNLTSITDPLNHQTVNQYDALNRLKQVTDPGNGTTSYAYDPLDQLTGVTDPRSLTTHYAVDNLGNVGSLQSPDTGTTVNTYDDAGNVITRTDAKGQATRYQYDALNRLTQITRADSSQIVYSYDDTRNGNHGIGHLTGMTDPSGSTTWTYDLHGRLTGKTQNTGGQTLATAWGYDNAGQLISTTLPSSSVIGYGWTNGRISSVTLNGTALVSNLQYQPFSGPKAWTFANGEALTKTYDLDGRITEHPLGTIGYDDASRITAIANANRSASTSSKTYDYDSLDRLTRASLSGTTSPLTYGYDATGNRTTQSGTTQPITYTIDPASNRIQSIANGTSSSLTPSYDANGSLTQDISNSYAYDAAGRLATANGASYQYNGQGQRTQKVIGSLTTHFAYDDQGHLTGEYDPTAGPIEETVWLGDQPIAVLRAGSIYYVHADHLNTPRQLDDSNGNAVWAWDTVSFGATTPNDDPQNTGSHFVYNLRHPGQYYDAESGLFQNNYRDYDPATGRYIESDPLGLAGGLNTYTYASGNPVSYIDPLGLYWVFSQKSGAISYYNETTGAMTPTGSGYAGNGPAGGANQPDREADSGTGPIPQGFYDIGPQKNNVTGNGTKLVGSMRLSPQAGTDTFGRGGFLIHGDNKKHDQSASEGCVVTSPNVRNKIGTSDDRTLRVVP